MAGTSRIRGTRYLANRSVSTLPPNRISSVSAPPRPMMMAPCTW